MPPHKCSMCQIEYTPECQHQMFCDNLCYKAYMDGMLEFVNTKITLSDKDLEWGIEEQTGKKVLVIKR